MVERGRGTILFSGCSASVNGIAGYSELCKCFGISLTNRLSNRVEYVFVISVLVAWNNNIMKQAAPNSL